MEDNVLGTGGVFQDGKDCGHGTPEVIGVEGHGHVDLGAAACFPVDEGWRFAEGGTDVWGGGGGGWVGGGGGGGGVNEEERQEAEEWAMRRGHPVFLSLIN